jgi:adenylate cyclase
MARQYYDTAREGDVRAQEAIERLCQRAVEIDPDYVRAWTLLGAVQSWLHFGIGRPADGGGAAIDRALSLDETSADAHAYKARHLFNGRRHDEGFAEIEVALALDPRSWAANSCAAGMYYHLRQFEDAARFYERCARLPDSAKGDPGQLLSCYMALGDADGMRRAAEMTVVRTEQALLSNHVNGAAVGCIAAYAVLGQPDRAQDLIRRSMLIDPENLRMCFNFACGAINYLHDIPLALEMLEQAYPKMTADWLDHVAIDPDLDPMREHPRFQALLAEATARVAAGN